MLNETLSYVKQIKKNKFDICQRSVPKGKITKAPLGKMPLIEIPFQRVAVDLVAPIEPRTS